jgi:hypothetical protein
MTPEVLTPTLEGRPTWNLDCLVAGSFTLPALLNARRQIINFLGMDTAGMAPDVRTYPLPDGRGGMGRTVYQPFVEPERTLLHQPLTTSFLILDVWPEHLTVTIKSCRQFDAAAVFQEIARVLGPLLDQHSWTLGMAARERRAYCGVGG